RKMSVVCHGSADQVATRAGVAGSRLTPPYWYTSESNVDAATELEITMFDDRAVSWYLEPVFTGLTTEKETCTEVTTPRLSVRRVNCTEFALTLLRIGTAVFIVVCVIGVIERVV